MKIHSARPGPLVHGLPVLLLCLLPPAALAQEASLLAGITDTDDHTHASYGWQLNLSQPLDGHAAASLGWINEGHVQGHRRDGMTGQLWLQTPSWHRLRLAVGAGPYVFFDTEPDDNRRGYVDHHGVGVVGSAAVSWQGLSPLTLRLNLNEIHAAGDYGTRALMLGLGYQLGRGESGAAPGAGNGALPGGPELQLFAGEATLNSLEVRRSATYGLDFQSATFLRWMSWAATWFHEPQTRRAPADRVAAQLRAEKHFDASRLTFGLGLGVYSTIGSYSGVESTTPNPEGLLLLRAGWQSSSHTSLIASWYRSFTQDDRDLDIITLGLAWRFGSD